MSIWYSNFFLRDLLFHADISFDLAWSRETTVCGVSTSVGALEIRRN